MCISIEKYFELLGETSPVMFVSLPGCGQLVTTTHSFLELRAQRNDLNLPDLRWSWSCPTILVKTGFIEACEEICRGLLDLDLLTPPD